MSFVEWFEEYLQSKGRKNRIDLIRGILRNNFKGALFWGRWEVLCLVWRPEPQPSWERRPVYAIGNDIREEQ